MSGAKGNRHMSLSSGDAFSPQAAAKKANNQQQAHLEPAYQNAGDTCPATSLQQSSNNITFSNVTENDMKSAIASETVAGASSPFSSSSARASSSSAFRSSASRSSLSSSSSSLSPGLLSARKRQRRGASRAAMDCFSCADRKVACDRRRPYCGQCLELGKQCAGYKTTLTWGMGVASRGKLRGLSAPYSGSAKIEGGEKDSPAGSLASDQRQVGMSEDNAAISSPSPLPPESPLAPPHFVRPLQFCSNTLQDRHGKDSGGSYQQPSEVVFSSMPIAAEPEPVMTSTAPVDLSAVPDIASQLSLRTIPQSPEFDQSPSLLQCPCLIKIQHQVRSKIDSSPDPPCRPPEDDHPGYAHASFYPDPGGEVNTSEATECHLMAQQAQQARQLATPTSSAYASPSFPLTTRNHAEGVAPPYMQQHWRQKPRLQTYIVPVSVPQPDGTMAVEYHKTNVEVPDGDDVDADANGQNQQNAVPGSQLTPMEVTAHIPRPVINEAVGNTRQLKYLIRFFTEAMAPVLVTFDKPRNPFTTVLLSLARSSDTLQHAIAALAVSNLRRRKENAVVSHEYVHRRSREASRHVLAALKEMTSERYQQQDGYSSLTFKEQLKEESWHRKMAISKLNVELADPMKRFNDSVLATLLIICLFHVCDTGIANFRSQFVGVRKLLSVRKATTGYHSEALKWCARTFFFFDAVTATVNNRDVEFTQDLVDSLSFEDDEWTIERMFGCDARLFRMVMQLSRINMLSQKRANTASHTAASSTTESPLSCPSTATMFQAPGASITASSELSTGTLPARPNSTPLASAPSEQDTEVEFWREWSRLRQQIETWHMLPMTRTATAFSFESGVKIPIQADFPWPPHAHHTGLRPALAGLAGASRFASINGADLIDLSRISECFRYASLLYLERLAKPDVPPSHPSLQQIVSLAIHHINTVESDVSLLWPLFITGSECIHETQRALIRSRCRAIYTDSGFVSTLASLNLLERIWAEIDAFDDVAQSTTSGATFRDGADHPQSFDGTGASPWGKEAFHWRRVVEASKSKGEYIIT